MTDRHTDPNDPLHVAFHEAGHAVIARVLGIRLLKVVSIVPDIEGGTAGIVHFVNQWRIVDDWEKAGLLHRDVQSAVRARIIASMAGAEAEAEILGQCTGGDDGDRRDIEAMAFSDDAEPMTPERWQHYEARMRRHTRWLIRRHREKIVRVTTTLLERKTLIPQQVDTLIAEGGAVRADEIRLFGYTSRHRGRYYGSFCEVRGDAVVGKISTSGPFATAAKAYKEITQLGTINTKLMQKGELPVSIQVQSVPEKVRAVIEQAIAAAAPHDAVPDGFHLCFRLRGFQP